MNGMHDDAWLDEQVRAAFDEVALPPDRVRALVARASGAPRRGSWTARITGTLVLLAAILTFALLVWPSSDGPDSAQPKGLAPAGRPPAPTEAPAPPTEAPAPPTRPPTPQGDRTELIIRSNRRVLVEVDGQAVGFAPTNVRTSPGVHHVRVWLPDDPASAMEQWVEVEAGVDLEVEFTMDPAPSPATVGPDIRGLWLGSYKPRDRSLKLTILRQSGPDLEGVIDLQNGQGSFDSFAVEGTIGADGRVTLKGAGATFEGRVNGQRASGQGTLASGQQILWSAVHPN